MKLQFKHQKFQADAAKAVVDVFAGQPYLTPTYMMDRGSGTYQIGMEEEHDFTGWRNERIVPELSDALILEHLNKIQRANQIAPSPKLEGRYNLTIEMETGVQINPIIRPKNLWGRYITPFYENVCKEGIIL